jgi:hypothetical protein
MALNTKKSSPKKSPVAIAATLTALLAQLSSLAAAPAFALNAKIDLATEKTIRDSKTTVEVLQKTANQGPRVATSVEAFASDARKSKLMIPYFFQVPRSEFSPIPGSVLQNGSKVTVIDQVRMNWVNGQRRGVKVPMVRNLNDLVGLRWTLVPQATDKAGRFQSATALGGSGMIQTGDVILSFRKEWYGSLPYSHLQLGISHAGLALLDKNQDGTSTVRNVDMPLDVETWGGAGNDHLSSKHYVEAPYLHIVRPTALHDGENDAQEKKNVEGWLRLIRQNASKFYKNPMTFNSDYMTSNYNKSADGKEDLTFVSDLARLALGGRIQGQYDAKKGYSMYCSEFAWIILSLKDCDPSTQKDAFLRGETPACVKSIMAPMPVLGNNHMALTFPDGSKRSLDGLPVEAGLADGAMMIADKMTELSESPARRNAFILGTFTTADGKPEHISSGHLNVQKGILAKNPLFFEHLKSYFMLTGNVMRMNPMALSDSDKAQIQQMIGLQLGFNERLEMNADGTPVMRGGQLVLKQGPLNYSPTAFLVHALLPRGDKLKSFSYVTSVMFMPEAQRKMVESQLKNLN